VSLLAVGEVVRAHKSALAARLIISNPCYLMGCPKLLLKKLQF
jgi:hypothetical protein